MKKPNEGDLFKTVILHGATFELRYGYYEDFERESAFGEPIPIYPDFLKNPQYTDDGYPFVTEMQSLCEHGNSEYSDGCCSDCFHYLNGDELIGICKCEKRRRITSPIDPALTTHPDRLEDK